MAVILVGINSSWISLGFFIMHGIIFAAHGFQILEYQLVIYTVIEIEMVTDYKAHKMKVTFI